MGDRVAAVEPADHNADHRLVDHRFGVGVSRSSSRASRRWVVSQAKVHSTTHRRLMPVKLRWPADLRTTFDGDAQQAVRPGHQLTGEAAVGEEVLGAAGLADVVEI